MPTSPLYHIQYTQLDPMTWCATALLRLPLPLDLCNWSPAFNNLPAYPIKRYQLSWQYCNHQSPSSTPIHAHHQRQQQRTGVRSLLQALLTKLAINDFLDESHFPYRLITSQYYVCFSHSKNKVAVVISKQRAVGIDIETNNIAWNVAQRFYHANEIAIIEALPTAQRDTVAKLLWQMKESFIKIQHYKLAQGLGIDYSDLIHHIVNSLKDESPLLVIDDGKTGYHIAILSLQQTVIIF